MALASSGAGLALSRDLLLVSVHNPMRLSRPVSLRASSAAEELRKYSVPLSRVAYRLSGTCAGQTVKHGVPSPSTRFSNWTTLTVAAPAARAALENA